ncbi:B-cell receptor CD22-like [Puntigrus tetrazona]|uniref:B-cell receptor CD22-like n=1 Tax=Puntigrus tetrazona TaxID=1606681 RepID=UPI001C8B0839|nr:B-cell receptor CD22-like [Puntigrus tetrazona]
MDKTKRLGEGQQLWTLNRGPSYVCALKGSTVNLSCVLNSPHDHELSTVFWTKTAVADGETSNLCLDPENRGRVQCFSGDKDTHFLTLSSVREADKHIYYCRLTTNRGTWTGFPGAQLDVTDLQVETEQTVKETDPVTLRCKSSCSLPRTSFIWFRNTERFTTGIISENQLHLQSVSRLHSGNYQCAVSGYEHLISPPVYLNVEYPLRSVRVSVSPSAEVVEGDSVTLICSSDSNPPALNFSWFKENQSSAVGSEQSLIISSFNSSHSGLYYCEAQNQHGFLRSASVSVSVKGVQRVVHILTGIVVGCGALIFIIFIIVFIRKRRDGGREDVNQKQTADDTYTALDPVTRTSADIYSTIRSGHSRSPDDTYTALELQSRSSEYETLAGASAGPH